MTRKRGYLWLTAVLLMALLIVVFMEREPQPLPNKGGENIATLNALQEAHPTLKDHYPRPRSSQHNRATYSPTHAIDDPQDATPIQPYSPPKEVFRKPSHTTVELNSADSLDLVQLYNIGPTFAKRILNYRSRLGGYVEKEQLWEVYGMDSVRFNDIAPYITIDTDQITQLDINTADIDQLKHHPYLDYYQAKAIVQMRERAGLYRNTEDLMMVPIIDKETYTKLTPYITCSSQQNK